MVHQEYALRDLLVNKQRMPTIEQKCCESSVAKHEHAGLERLHYCGFPMGEK
jgi:hypothetical protein